MILASSFLNAPPVGADALQFENQNATESVENTFLAVFSQLTGESALLEPQDEATEEIFSQKLAAETATLLTGSDALQALSPNGNQLIQQAKPEITDSNNLVLDIPAAHRELEKIASKSGRSTLPENISLKEISENSDPALAQLPVSAEKLLLLQKEIRAAKIPGVKIRLEQSRSGAAFSVELPIKNAEDGAKILQTVNEKTEGLLGQEFTPGKHKQTFALKSKNLSTQAPANKTLVLEMMPVAIDENSSNEKISAVKDQTRSEQADTENFSSAEISPEENSWLAQLQAAANMAPLQKVNADETPNLETPEIQPEENSSGTKGQISLKRERKATKNTEALSEKNILREASAENVQNGKEKFSSELTMPIAENKNSQPVSDAKIPEKKNSSVPEKNSLAGTAPVKEQPDVRNITETKNFDSIQDIINKAAESKSPIQSIVLKYKVTAKPQENQIAEMIRELPTPRSLAKRLESESIKNVSNPEVIQSEQNSPVEKVAGWEKSFFQESGEVKTVAEEFLPKEIAEENFSPKVQQAEKANVFNLPLDKFSVQIERKISASKHIEKKFPTASAHEMTASFLRDEKFAEIFAGIAADEDAKQENTVSPNGKKSMAQEQKENFPVKAEGKKKFSADQEAKFSRANSMRLVPDQDRSLAVNALQSSESVRQTEQKNSNSEKKNSSENVKENFAQNISKSASGSDENTSFSGENSAKENFLPKREVITTKKEKFDVKDFAQFSPVTAQKANIEQKFEVEAPRPTVRIHIENFSNGAATLIRALPEEAGGMARIVLTPDALGRVEVNVNMQQNSGIIRLEVDNIVAKHALEAQMPALQEKLSQHGIQVDKVEVTLKHEQEAYLGGGAQQHQGRGREEGEERQNFVRSFQHLNEAAQKSGKQINYQEFIRQYA